MIVNQVYIKRGNNSVNIITPLRKQHNISLLTMHDTGVLLYNFIVVQIIVNYAQAIAKHNKGLYYVLYRF